MVRKRAKRAGVTTTIGNHTFRGTGITAYLKNGGTLRARRIREGGGFVDAEETLAIDGAREIEANIFAAEVFRAIAQLPEAQREAALLVYCEGYSYAEAASALGIPIGTVMSRLAAARSALADLK